MQDIYVNVEMCQILEGLLYLPKSWIDFCRQLGVTKAGLLRGFFRFAFEKKICGKNREEQDRDGGVLEN